MAVKIIWSNEAEITFEKNIDYLQKNWTDKEISGFIKQTNFILSRIEVNPLMYMASPKSRFIRKAPINKYIILYFRYYISKKQVVLLSFWHSKQNPSKLKY